jgi:hypothetical protein
METVACLRSKCHLKQNLIPSWPWSFRHTSCISDFRCKTKYTNKLFFSETRTGILGSIAGPCDARSDEFQKVWDCTPLIIFTNLANIFAYMTIIVRSMYNFVNCLQFNIRYEKVERPAPVLLFVCVCMEDIQIKYLYKQISLVAYNERYSLIFLRFHYKIVFVHLTHLNYLYLSISYRIQPSDRCGLCSMLR